MHETDVEVAELQALLDRSYANAGEHLLSIHTPDWRVPASELVSLMTGMVVPSSKKAYCPSALSETEEATPGES